MVTFNLCINKQHLNMFIIKVLLPFNQVFKRCSKSPILTCMAKITDSSIYLAFKPLIESRLIQFKSNIHKICGPNIYVVFNPRKNFQELQLDQTLMFFSEFWCMSRSQHSRQKSVRDFPKKCCFLFYLCFSVFPKLSYDCVAKNP